MGVTAHHVHRTRFRQSKLFKRRTNGLVGDVLEIGIDSDDRERENVHGYRAGCSCVVPGVCRLENDRARKLAVFQPDAGVGGVSVQQFVLIKLERAFDLLTVCHRLSALETACQRLVTIQRIEGSFNRRRCDNGSLEDPSIHKRYLNGRFYIGFRNDFIMKIAVGNIQRSVDSLGFQRIGIIGRCVPNDRNRGEHCAGVGFYRDALRRDSQLRKGRAQRFVRDGKLRKNFRDRMPNASHNHFTFRCCICFRVIGSEDNMQAVFPHKTYAPAILSLECKLTGDDGIRSLNLRHSALERFIQKLGADIRFGGQGWQGRDDGFRRPALRAAVVSVRVVGAAAYGAVAIGVLSVEAFLAAVAEAVAVTVAVRPPVGVEGHFHPTVDGDSIAGLVLRAVGSGSERPAAEVGIVPCRDGIGNHEGVCLAGHGSRSAGAAVGVEGEGILCLARLHGECDGCANGIDFAVVVRIHRADQRIYARCNVRQSKRRSPAPIGCLHIDIFRGYGSAVPGCDDSTSGGSTADLVHIRSERHRFSRFYRMGIPDVILFTGAFARAGDLDVRNRSANDTDILNAVGLASFIFGTQEHAVLCFIHNATAEKRPDVAHVIPDRVISAAAFAEDRDGIVRKRANRSVIRYGNASAVYVDATHADICSGVADQDGTFPVYIDIDRTVIVSQHH